MNKNSLRQVSFFNLEPQARSFFEQNLSGIKSVFFSGALSNRNIKAHANSQALCVFVNSKVDARLLSKLHKVRLICCMSTGFDHVDLEACKKRGITVCNVPSYGENTVAEHTFALILNLSRKVHLAIERTVRGNFSTKGLTGWDLFGKTIGIVGAGRIGYHVARIARGFGMNVLVSDPKPKSDWKKEFGARFVSLNELLKESDVVSLHCPLMPQTRHLINRKNIRLMKPSAILVNTARGAIVDTQALSWALSKKIIAGAGLDVLENEEAIQDETQLLFRNLPAEQKELLLLEYMMLTKSNVIITPHNAFNSYEALQRILDQTLSNIGAFRKGKPINQIV